MIRPKKTNSRAFTLLEIVIVLALIAVVAALGTSSLTDLLAQNRRKSEVEELKNFIQELQIEALALRSDFEITFVRKGNELQVRSQTAEKIIPDRTLVLKEIRAIKFQDQLLDTKKTFRIFSTGRIDPAGMIEIENNKSSLWIDFRYPLCVKFSDKPPVFVLEVVPNKPPKKEVVCS